jgi:hypothetical protein
VFFSFSPGKVRLSGLFICLKAPAACRYSLHLAAYDAIDLPWIIMAIMEWKPMNTVPLERDVEIAATDSTGMHAVACPCRLTERGWIAAESKRRLYWVRPTHWRDLSRNEPNENSPEAERGSASPVAPLF